MTRRVPARFFALAVAGSAILATACSGKPKTFTTNVQLVEINPVTWDQAENITSLDLKVSFVDCPGDQEKIFRGDKAFAECVWSNKRNGDKAKHNEGDKVPATVSFYPRADGSGYKYDIIKVANCERKVDPLDRGSDYDHVQTCKDLVVNGVNIGVRCDRTRNAELLKKCPWFQVH